MHEPNPPAPRKSLEAAMLQAALDCIITIDDHGRIIEFNPSAERTFGFARADVIGREMADLIVPPALRDAHRRGLAACVAAGGRGPILDQRLEMPALRADGSEFPVELTITRVSGDGPLIFTGYVRDITDRRRAERRRTTELAVTQVLAQAATAEEGMRGIIQAVCESLHWDCGAIWTTDDDAQVIRCVDFWHLRDVHLAAFEDITRASVFAPGVGLPGRVWRSGEPCWILDVVEDGNFPRAPIALHDDLHGAFAFPVRLRGQIVGVVEFFSRQIEQPDADLLATMAGVGGHIGQFLERKRADAALRDADRRKDEFLATLAHELRNPLAPIGNSLAIMRIASQNRELTDHARDVIERQVTHLVRLVDDLLDVSRITLNKIELRRSRVSLETVIRSALETSRPLIEAARHEVTVTMSADPIWIHVDPIRIAQAISNLVNNAVKYTPAQGQIWVTGERQGSEAVVTVRDTGIGIPAHMLPRVFDLFAQTDQARERSPGGLGIGLTVAKNLVEMHGGRVAVQSEGADRGSEFRLRLPLAVENTPDHGIGRSVSLEPGGVGSGGRVLIVDDNQDSADSLCLLVELMGYQARVAFDGPSALEIATFDPPDVALLDIGLPGMSGYELAQRLRALPGRPSLVLIAITGWGQAEDRRRSEEAGFDHHLIKPADPAVLQQLLHAATRK